MPMYTDIDLRPWQESDAEILFTLASDPVIGQSAGFPPHRDVADSRRVIREILVKSGAYAVVSALDDVVVGCVSALPCKPEVFGEGVREIGYWIGRPYWGRGFATAAVSALCRQCRTEPVLDCRCLIGRVRTENVRSRRVLEKCGFRISGIANGLSRYALHFSDLPCIERDAGISCEMSTS